MSTLLDVVRPRRRVLALLSAAVVAALGLGAPVHADPLDPHLGDPGTTLPNLVPNVSFVEIQRPWLFDEETETVFEGPPILYFDSWAQNLGSVPLQLAFGGVEDPETAIAEQCISWRSVEAHLCRESVPVGGFSWHDEHAHFHYNEFAAYELRRFLRNGRVDYSRSGLISSSEKVSFCLIDSLQVRADASPAPFYATCSPTVEGISAGWTDIYSSSLPGQQLSLEGLADGHYALVIRLDYANRIHETVDTDNVVEATVQLSDGVRQAAIVGRNYPESS